MTLGGTYYSFSVIIVVRKIWKEAMVADTGISCLYINETSCFGSRSCIIKTFLIAMGISIMWIFALNIGRQSASAVSCMFPDCIKPIVKNIYTKTTHSAKARKL